MDLQLKYAREFLAKEQEEDGTFWGIPLAEFTAKELRKMIGIMSKRIGRRNSGRR